MSALADGIISPPRVSPRREAIKSFCVSAASTPGGGGRGRSTEVQALAAVAAARDAVLAAAPRSWVDSGLMLADL